SPPSAGTGAGGAGSGSAGAEAAGRVTTTSVPAATAAVGSSRVAPTTATEVRPMVQRFSQECIGGSPFCGVVTSVAWEAQASEHTFLRGSSQSGLTCETTTV